MGQDMSWTRQFGTVGDDTAEDMAVDEAGNLYVVGCDGPPRDGCGLPSCSNPGF